MHFPPAEWTYLRAFEGESTCGRCPFPFEDHVWICGGCHERLGLGGERIALHTVAHGHSPTPFLVCPLHWLRMVGERVPHVRAKRDTRRRPSAEPSEGMTLEQAEDLLLRGCGLEAPLDWASDRTRMASVFRAFALRWHPDRAGKAGEAKMKAGNEAWRVVRQARGW